MKFKYKKMVVMITMGTMLIGCVIFSTVTPNKDKAASTKTVETQENDKEETTLETTKEETNIIKKDLNEKVSQVVKDYLIASVACDMDALEDTVNDISMINEEELKLKYEYVEAVNNIECYMVPGPDGKGYVVYTYRDLKLKDIDTLAPGLSRVYVEAGDNGEYRVFFGADTGLEDFISKTDKSSEVTELVNKVNVKMEEAVSSDADLKAFVDKITVSGKTNKSDKEDSKKKDSNE